MENLNDVLYIEVFLAGELSPDYERLRKAIEEKLSEIKLYAEDNVVFKFTDPNAITNKKIRDQYFSQLIQRGIAYNLERVEEGSKVEEKLIFPSAMLSLNGKEVPVSFMKGSKILPIEQQLNQGVEGVEYELVSALRKLKNTATKSLAFIEGHGELPKENTSDISSALSEYYNVATIKLTDSINLSQFQTLVLAGPTQIFSEKEKFLLDQYLVNGGSLLILADALNLNADSLVNGFTYAIPYNTGLESLLFKYGLRLNPDLIQDLNCGLIKVATGNGDQTQTVNWPYYPILYNYGKHPIVKSLDAISSNYISSIDTVKANGIIKTPLIFTTNNTKLINAPAKLDLNSTRQTIDPATFNKGQKCVGYLLEGQFESAYKNFPSTISTKKVISKNKNGRIIFISDSDIIRNEYDFKKNKPVPLGFDPTINYNFSNKDFLIHSFDYLMYESIIGLRNKEIALRPLDKIRIQNEKLFWQILNILSPIILILIYGIVRYVVRKRRHEAEIQFIQ